MYHRKVYCQVLPFVPFINFMSMLDGYLRDLIFVNLQQRRGASVKVASQITTPTWPALIIVQFDDAQPIPRYPWLIERSRF